MSLMGCSERIAKVVAALQAPCRRLSSLMDAIYIGILRCYDMKSPIHPGGLTGIALDFDRNNVLASRVTTNFLQRDALKIRFRDRRIEHRSPPWWIRLSHVEFALHLGYGNHLENCLEAATFLRFQLAVKCGRGE